MVGFVAGSEEGFDVGFVVGLDGGVYAAVAVLPGAVTAVACGFLVGVEGGIFVALGSAVIAGGVAVGDNAVPTVG